MLALSYCQPGCGPPKAQSSIPGMLLPHAPPPSCLPWQRPRSLGRSQRPSGHCQTRQFQRHGSPGWTRQSSTGPAGSRNEAIWISMWLSIDSMYVKLTCEVPATPGVCRLLEMLTTTRAQLARSSERLSHISYYHHTLTRLNKLLGAVTDCIRHTRTLLNAWLPGLQQADNLGCLPYQPPKSGFRDNVPSQQRSM